EVVAAAGLTTQVAEAVADPAAVADNQLIFPPGVTHGEIAAIAPDRATADDEGNIVTAGNAVGENAVEVFHQRAVAHHEPAGRPVAADKKIVAHAPSRARADQPHFVGLGGG